MKLRKLYISNVLSFDYFNNINDAACLAFDEKVNILIGENGSGKTTALEAINFIFKRVVCKRSSIHSDRLEGKTAAEIQNAVELEPDGDTGSFRLGPNWSTPEEPQHIKAVLELDDIDHQNILTIKTNWLKLNTRTRKYTSQLPMLSSFEHRSEYELVVAINPSDRTFKASFHNAPNDFGCIYLTHYNLFRDLIQLHNEDYPDETISQLHEPFAIISGYRNYSAFGKSVSLQKQPVLQQLNTLRTRESSRSLNSPEHDEPAIFELVRLRVAEKHYDLFGTAIDDAECEKRANDQGFVNDINQMLKLVNLEFRVRLVSQRNWNYAVILVNTRRGERVDDINSLSAGQKAILHLLFEAYGRGDLKGGLLIIDEPEIHLHHQFQHEYVRIVNRLQNMHSTQYILVTHSEALINSATIGDVKRLSLSDTGATQVYSPVLSLDQKTLVKILDNTRSTYAFFARKVVLVEGETDRYFFKAALNELYPEAQQEIAILDISGSSNYQKWAELFRDFGLLVFSIQDLDALYRFCYPTEPKAKLTNSEAVQAFKVAHLDWADQIEAIHRDGIAVLQGGDLESYLLIPKKLERVIEFCNNNIQDFLADRTNKKSQEMVAILTAIVDAKSGSLDVPMH